MLAVEVANTGLTFDRTVKLALYARSGIPELWHTKSYTPWQVTASSKYRPSSVTATRQRSSVPPTAPQAAFASTSRYARQASPNARNSATLAESSA